MDEIDAPMLQSQWQSYLETTTKGPTGVKGVCYLPELALLEFAGTDALTFLQGYLTSDVFKLNEDDLSPTALCNLKGRVVANGWCTRGADTVELIVHRSLAEPLAHFLKNYLVFSKTELVDCTDSHLIFGSIDQPDDSGLPIGGGYRLHIVDELDAARELNESVDSLGHEHWARRLIEDKTALVSLPVSERFLPQMLALDRSGAVSFDKGCYLGQEVVARAQHRGQVKRELATLTWQGVAPLPGADFSTADARSAGVVIQSVATANASGICLAIVADTAKATKTLQKETSFQLVA